MCGCKTKISGMGKGKTGIGSTQKKILAAVIGVGAASAASIGVGYFKDDLVGLVTKEGATAEELQTGRHIVNTVGVALGLGLAYASTMLSDETMAQLAAGAGVGVAAQCATSLAGDMLSKDGNNAISGGGIGNRWMGKGLLPPTPYNNNSYGLFGIDNNNSAIMGIDNNNSAIMKSYIRRDASGRNGMGNTVYDKFPGFGQTVYKADIGDAGGGM